MTVEEEVGCYSLSPHQALFGFWDFFYFLFFIFYNYRNPIQLHIQTIGNLNSLKKYKEESTLILLSKVYLCSCSYGFINEYFRVEFVVFCVVSIEKGVALFA